MRSSTLKLFAALAFILGPTLTLAQGVNPGSTIPSPHDNGLFYMQPVTNLSISAYYYSACKGGPGMPEMFTPKYGQLWSVQFYSYFLTRELADNEQLDFYDALPGGGKLNADFNGNDVTCSYYMGTAHSHNASLGCSDVARPYGCMKLWIPPK